MVSSYLRLLLEWRKKVVKKLQGVLYMKRDIDLNNRLEITINNSRHVALTDLSLSLLSLSSQYQRFVESECNDSDKISSELLIKEVRKGSIVVELISHAAPLVPLFWEGGPLHQWLSSSASVLKWLLGEDEKAPKDVSKSELQDWVRFLAPVAKDDGSQMNIVLNDSAKLVQNITITHKDAVRAQQGARSHIERLEESEDNIFRKQMMIWNQAKFDSSKKTGNKAIIESISKSPLKVIFENDAIKHEMLHPQPHFSTPWHELAYIVDVEVQTVQGKPKLYKVLRYYPDDTFDPS